MEIQLLVEDWGYSYLVENGPNDQSFMGEAKFDATPGKTKIRGVFMQANVVNGNGRVYPKKILEKAVDKYIKEQVKPCQALGELNHPPRPNVDPAEAAIRITDLWWEGDNVMGEAIVLNTPKGNIVKGLIEGGWVPGVSSRGLGSVKSINGINEVQEGYRLTVGVDVVWGPSAPNAYVRASVNESVEISNLKNGTDLAFMNLTKSLEKFL